MTIVVVRFFGLARPLARYLERLASHDLALRVLGRIRVDGLRADRAARAGELDGYRRGDLLAGMVGDVDALQGLYLRGLGPPLVALVVATACVVAAAVVLPAAAVVLGARPARSEASPCRCSPRGCRRVVGPAAGRRAR